MWKVLWTTLKSPRRRGERFLREMERLQVDTGAIRHFGNGTRVCALWTIMWMNCSFMESRGRMKSFYSPTAADAMSPAVGDIVSAGDPPVHVRDRCSGAVVHIGTRARVAVYDAMSAAPRVVDVAPAPVNEFIEQLTSTIHELCRAEGGSVPYTVIREVTENFIHAEFAELVVSILDAGATIRFADQGPGITDKDRALLPGFTTANGDMKRYIRGVGSGLPIVREYLIHSGGSLAIEDNLGSGSVVTVYAGPRHRTEERPVEPRWTSSARGAPVPGPSQPAEQSSFPVEEVEDQPVARPRLTARQQHVLALVLESGLAGPSLVAKELGVGISTAYRDLALLEEAGLIAADGGKRTLTTEGLSYLGDLMNRS